MEKKRWVGDLVVLVFSMVVGIVAGATAHSWAAFVILTLLLTFIGITSRSSTARDKKYDEAVRSAFDESLESIETVDSDFQDMKKFKALTASGHVRVVYVNQEFKAIVKAD